jgi:hypothetical protein
MPSCGGLIIRPVLGRSPIGAQVVKEPYTLKLTTAFISGDAMKYLCLVVLDEKKLDALSSKESEELDDESLAYDEVLRKGGHFLAAQALESVQAATTIRLHGGKVSVTDGPFAETHEQIGGFILMEARDLNEAIQLASKIPVLRLGGIEVRPIKELTHSNRKE